MNPYADKDRLHAEEEAAGEAFARWCENMDITDPTDADREQYEDELQEAHDVYLEGIAEDRANAY